MNLGLRDSELEYKGVLTFCKAGIKKVVQEEEKRLKVKYELVILALKSVIDARGCYSPEDSPC